MQQQHMRDLAQNALDSLAYQSVALAVIVAELETESPNLAGVAMAFEHLAEHIAASHGAMAEVVTLLAQHFGHASAAEPQEAPRQAPHLRIVR